ncbi:MAG: hypothetical protein BWZ02_01537 [Lentisphaerae bacterium ADurb.BinA184]|nr:MAG: hypothetical protein BWZ02_01537 [Lentisphaerae bacterium ADurb.BinA184]
MTLSHAARERLLRLTRRCGRGGGGLRFLGAVGSCRGAVPLLEPDTQPRDGEETVEIEGVRFFVPAARRARFDAAAIEAEGGLFRQGLRLTWPHDGTCACASTDTDRP